MKKIMSFAALLLVALTTMLTLVSCGDEVIASDLEGTWRGTMKISKLYRSHTYTSTYTEIEFSKSPYKYKSGSGYWVDYYSGAPWDYVANHIDWSVSDGRITVYFREEGTTMFIDNYSLSEDYFDGYIIDGNSRVKFSLEHVSSPNWGSYTYWDEDYWDSYSYSKQGTFTPDVESRSQDSAVNVSQPKRFLNVK